LQSSRNRGQVGDREAKSERQESDFHDQEIRTTGKNDLRNLQHGKDNLVERSLEGRLEGTRLEVEKELNKTLSLAIVKSEKRQRNLARLCCDLIVLQKGMHVKKQNRTVNVPLWYVVNEAQKVGEDLHHSFTERDNRGILP